jgi:hypothetical protein
MPTFTEDIVKIMSEENLTNLEFIFDIGLEGCYDTNFNIDREAFVKRYRDWERYEQIISDQDYEPTEEDELFAKEYEAFTGLRRIRFPKMKEFEYTGLFESYGGKMLRLSGIDKNFPVGENFDLTNVDLTQPITVVTVVYNKEYQCEKVARIVTKILDISIEPKNTVVATKCDDDSIYVL